MRYVFLVLFNTHKQPLASPLQLAAAAALANLSADRCGLEAMVADQELLLPLLWTLARSLVVQVGRVGMGGWRFQA